MAESERRKKGKWTEIDMKRAVSEVRSHRMSQRQAATAFSVPKTTLGDRLRDIEAGRTVMLTPQMGRFQSTFSDEIENQLVFYMRDQDDRFMPLSRKEFMKLSFDLAEHLKIPHQFNKQNKAAGKQFYYDFMARHPELSLRRPESTSLQRALGFNKHQVERFFKKYSELLDMHSFSPSRIHNCDETGVSIVHDNDVKVIAQKGKKQVSKVTSGERGKNVTVLLSINAAGDIFVPPLFVFPNKQRVDAVLKKDAPSGSIFAAEESGWISAKSFLKWLELFVERTRPTKEEPVLLILDGHSSHKDLNVILFAKTHHVHMISLPPHTTHKMQPLDRAVMRPFKAAYNQACGVWMRKYRPLKISQKDVAGLVNTAYTSICRMDLAQSAFACTGLWPLNPGVFTELDFIPSEHFREPEPIDCESGSVNLEARQLVSSTHSEKSNLLESTVTSLTPANLPEHGPASDVTSTPLNRLEPGTSTQNNLPEAGPSSAVTSTHFTVLEPGTSTQTNLPEQGPSSSVTSIHRIEPQLSLSPAPVSNSLFHPSLQVSSVTTDFQKILAHISPGNHSSEIKVKRRKQRTQQSEILTSTPYKDQLEEKKKLAEEKRLKAEKRKAERELRRIEKDKRATKSSASQDRKKKIGDKTHKKHVKKLDFVEVRSVPKPTNEITECIICRESFEEDWVQCINCQGWAHVECTDQENIAHFSCDVCKHRA